MTTPPPPPYGRSPSPVPRGRTDYVRQRLYLITPLVDDAASFAPQLERALGSGDVAAVLLRLAQGGERSLVERVKSIGAVVQSRDIALIVDGHAEIVARAGADGSHLTGLTAFAAALAALKPDRIVGVGPAAYAAVMMPCSPARLALTT